CSSGNEHERQGEKGGRKGPEISDKFELLLSVPQPPTSDSGSAQFCPPADSNSSVPPHQQSVVAQWTSPTRAGAQPSGHGSSSSSSSSSDRAARSPARLTAPPTSIPGTAVTSGSSSSPPPPLSEVKLGWDTRYPTATAMAAAAGTSCIPPPVSTGNPTAGTAADAGPEGGGGPST
ncbi:unnamed protein product, partial [Ectocarpus sp. 12 AP-2014]